MINFRKYFTLCGAMLGISIMALQPATVFAANATLTKAPIRFWYPDNWSQKYDGGALRLDGPNDEVMMLFDIVRSSGVDSALENLEARLRRFGVNNFLKVGDEERQINGMSAQLNSGTALKNNQRVQMGIAIIDVSPQNTLLLFSIVKDAAAARHKQSVMGVINSISPRR